MPVETISRFDTPAPYGTVVCLGPCDGCGHAVKATFLGGPPCPILLGQVWLCVSCVATSWAR